VFEYGKINTKNIKKVGKQYFYSKKIKQKKENSEKRNEKNHSLQNILEITDISKVQDLFDYSKKYFTLLSY